MTDKNYQIILLGKIAEGYDKEIVYEKLAIVFELDLKKIPKLLKKPAVIRKNLTQEIALRYQVGLDKIGALCEISPPLGLANPIEEEHQPIFEDETQPITSNEEESKTFSFVRTDKLILDGDRLRVTNVKMPTKSMIIFLIKWAFASIPALILLGGSIYLIQMGLKMIGLL